MHIALPDVALDLGRAVDAFLLDLGGVDLARAAENSYSTEALAVAFDGLGANDIRPLEDLEQACVAAEVSRVAGRHVAPFPIVSLLLQDEGGTPFVVVPDDSPMVNHGRAFETWRGVTLSGSESAMLRPEAALGSKLGPFLTPMRVMATSPAGDRDARAALLYLVLDAWLVIGGLQRALELVIDHLKSREQFGQPLSSFQAIQHEVADAAVATDGLSMLAKFTLWRLWHADRRFHRGDVLALRLSMIESGRSVLRTCQQFFGASGLCDEYDISLLVRHLQPSLRLPMTLHQTTAQLAQTVAVDGFEEIYPHGALAMGVGV